ncbi:MAG: FAD-dependent oxidoreductase [Chlorobium sp.]|nr:FAD-dependent oxidoreductase [Chlorobium sp.]
MGGGINGLCCAWELAKVGHYVTLYEKNLIMQATSRSSSKLLRGGLRYLENAQLRLVGEALHERDLWLSMVPHLAKPLPIIYPRYQSGKRSKWVLDRFMSIEMSHFVEKIYSLFVRVQHLKDCFCLTVPHLMRCYIPDYMLGMWVAQQCSELGVQIKERAEVREFTI